MTRRQLLGDTAALAAAVSSGAAQAAAEPYQLGCQTLPYRSFPLARALQGIQKAGYKYVMINAQHQREVVFGPSLSAEARAAVRRQISDAGLTPFMIFAGMSKEYRAPDWVDVYKKELDFCREFGIGTTVGTGPWYYTKFPGVPYRDLDWQKMCDEFYGKLEQVVRHAESVGVTITLKPHTGITANARECMKVVKRLPSPRLKISWDAGNVSFYEGIHPDPDLPDLAPDVKSVCIKDHQGGRAEANFPVPGSGQIDHPLMFKILFGAGFRGPLAVERVDGRDNAAKMTVEVIDERLAQAREYLAGALEKAAKG